MAVKIIYFLLALTTLLPTLTSSAPQKFVNPYSVLSKPIVDDESFNFQMLIGLGLAQYGGADAAELLSAAQVVKPLSFPSWNQTFYDLAAKTQALAKSYKNPLNAQRTYFRAATYYRLADFYNHAVWSNPLINEYWVQQLACFDAAIATLPVPGLRVTLPADDFNTIGIFFSPAPPPVSGAPIKRPTIIIGNGYDAAQEDSFHQTGIAALARGWNVLVYEGPGQPTVRRQQNIGFIYDWERVVTPAVDYLYSRPNVDTSRIALMGVSMGGYLAPRAAAFEPRINAVIADGGIYDLQQSFLQQYGPEVAAMFAAGNKTELDDTINQYVIANTSASSSMRWGVEQGRWSFKTHSSYEVLSLSANYTLANGLTQRIKVPVWIANATADPFFGGQPQLLKNALGPRATMETFAGPYAQHSQAGAFEYANERIFAWLEGVLGIAWGNGTAVV